MYDMSGKPVWFLPASDQVDGAADLKVSPSGSLTLLSKGNGFEVSWGGKILWSTTAGSKSNNNAGHSQCHHEFTKTRNNHYFALVSEMMDPVQQPQLQEGKKRFFPALFMSTLEEFDENGNVVWRWESQKYFETSDLWALHQRYPGVNIDLHENAFCFDETEQVLYLSMATINRILKIQYPSGNVLAEYGTKFHSSQDGSSDSAMQNMAKIYSLFANKYFVNQHSLSQADGKLYTLSKGDPNDNSATSYQQVATISTSGNTLKTEWQFNCNISDRTPPAMTGGGGNVTALPDHTLFVSLGVPYEDIFIVNQAKEVLWSAITEVCQPSTHEWLQFTKYRSSFVSRPQLEQMIWNDAR